MMKLPKFFAPLCAILLPSTLCLSMEDDVLSVKTHSSTTMNPWGFDWESFISPDLVPPAHKKQPYLMDMSLHDDTPLHMVSLLEIESIPQDNFAPFFTPQPEQTPRAKLSQMSTNHGGNPYWGQLILKDYHRPSNQVVISSSLKPPQVYRGRNRLDIMTLILRDLTASPIEKDLAKWECLTRQAKRHWDPTGNQTFAGFSNFLKEYLRYYLSSGEEHSKIKILSQIAASIYDNEERPLNAKARAKKRKRMERKQEDDKDLSPHAKKKKE